VLNGRGAKRTQIREVRDLIAGYAVTAA